MDFLIKSFPPPAHLFLMCCVGGILNKWIFMDVQKAYMYHSDFHPCHQAMQITSSHLHAARSFSLINDAGKMFFLPRKISSFKTESLQILMGSNNFWLVLTWRQRNTYSSSDGRISLFWLDIIGWYRPIADVSYQCIRSLISADIKTVF